MALTAAPNGCPPAYDGCTCACHRQAGIVHFAPCCRPKLNMPTDPEWYREKAKLEGGYDVTAGAPDHIPDVGSMVDPLNTKATEHPRIWLEPTGDADRCWCNENQWDDEGIEYVLASAAESRVLSLEEEVKVLRDIARRSRLMTGVMEGLTGCRGDDEWVWALQADLDVALSQGEKP